MLLKVVKNIFLTRYEKYKINLDYKFYMEFKHLKIHDSNKNSCIVQIL